MKQSDRKALASLRGALLHLHKALLDWERASYERTHGRTSPGELLKIIVADSQFAWLRPMSDLIVHIDAALDVPEAEPHLDAIITQAHGLITPDATDAAYAERYLAALQDSPDAVIAHRGVTEVLRDVPWRHTLH